MCRYFGDKGLYILLPVLRHCSVNKGPARTDIKIVRFASKRKLSLLSEQDGPSIYTYNMLLRVYIEGRHQCTGDNVVACRSISQVLFVCILIFQPHRVRHSSHRPSFMLARRNEQT